MWAASWEYSPNGICLFAGELVVELAVSGPGHLQYKMGFRDNPGNALVARSTVLI